MTSGTLTFQPGQQSQTFAVPIINDGAIDGTETVNLTLSNPTNAGLGTPNPSTLNISDPTRPTIQFSAANYDAAENNSTATITATISAASTQTVTVDYSTYDGTATANVDYQPASGTLTFQSGQTSQMFQVRIIDDQQNDGSETVGLALSNPTNATLGTPNPAALTIDGGLVAGVTVQLEKSVFQHGYDMMDEETDAMLTDHWVDTNHNGVIDQPGEHSYPYAYVRGSTLSLAEADFIPTESFPPIGLPPTSLLLFRADVFGEGQQVATISRVTASFENGIFVLRNVTADAPLVDTVYSYKPLTIAWYASSNGGLTWQAAGKSNNRLYLTFAAQDKSEIPYETLYAYGSDGGKGATTAQETFDGIWKNFSGLKPKSAQTGKLFYYYKNWLLSSSFLALPGNPLSFFKTREGQCGVWTEFLVWCMAKQGLFKDPQFSPAGAVVIQSITSTKAVAGFGDEWLLIKNWAFPTPTVASHNDPVYIYTNFIGPAMQAGNIPDAVWLLKNARVIALPPAQKRAIQTDLLDKIPRMKKVNGDWQYDFNYSVAPFPPTGPDVTDQAGVAGQNTANPISVFPNHAVVKIKVNVGGQLIAKLFDPSYGVVYDDPMDLQNKAVAGFYIVRNISPDPAKPEIKIRAMLIREPTVQNGQVQLEIKATDLLDVGANLQTLTPGWLGASEYPF